MTDITARSALVDAALARGAVLEADKTNNALNRFGDVVAEIMRQVKKGKADKEALNELSDHLQSLLATPGSILALPSGTASTFEREHPALVKAVRDGSVELDPATGLPKAADEGAEVDNTLKTVEGALGITTVTTVGGNPARLKAIVDEIAELNKPADLGDIAKELGLKPDAEAKDVTAAAKAAKVAADADAKTLGEIAKELGLPADAKSADILSAAKAAKAASSSKRPALFGGK